jgi:uncharacterized protein YegP (UPF0339 family)/menaquinone-dependent protoporphyrinogen IX oxidase
MVGKTLIVFATKTGINEQAAIVIANTLKANFNADVTIKDLKNGSPDITPFQNIIVGGGVQGTKVYDAAVDFMEKDFEGKNVALYFTCEDNETPKPESTENNKRKLLAKNSSLKPIDVTAFGGCMLKGGRPVMDEQNMSMVQQWAAQLGKMLSERESLLVEVAPVIEMPETEKVVAGSFEIHCDAGGKFRFHLKAANGEIIAVSQAYTSKQSAENGIASVKKNAPLAKIVDLTAEAT